MIVAYEVTNVGHDRGTFRQGTGMTPGEYRRGFERH
jgi:hypothetical protein